VPRSRLPVAVTQHERAQLHTFSAVTELDAWKASPDSLSHRADWIHPDDHAALVAEIDTLRAALSSALANDAQWWKKAQAALSSGFSRDTERMRHDQEGKR
jgi:hypothetical protein